MISLRRVFTQVGHIHHEFGPRAETPLGRGAIAAVLAASSSTARWWHVPGGYAMRELLGWKGDRNAYRQGTAEEKTVQPGNALSIVPSTRKVGCRALAA